MDKRGHHCISITRGAGLARLADRVRQEAQLSVDAGSAGSPVDFSQPQAEQERELRGSTRDLEREMLACSRAEAKLESEIRDAGKRGDMAGARILAKQLIRTREQKQRLLQVKGHLASTKYALKNAATQTSLNKAITSSTRAMVAMNQHVPLDGLERNLAAFEAQTTKMELKQEAMDDAVDSIFEADETKESELMNQIYDEIGLEISRAPVLRSQAQVPPKQVTDEQVDAFIRAHEDTTRFAAE